MIPTKLGAKKSKAKRKASEDHSDDSQYGQKKTSKLRKLSKMSKKEADNQKHKKKSEKLLNKYDVSNSDSDEIKSLKQSPEKPKVVYVHLEQFNADKIFAQILNRANKQPDFLIMLKNLLSGCSRNMNDKKNVYKKKWKQLRNSNCTQQQYINRQGELKRSESQQIHEMEKDIMTKLSFTNIKGFQTKNSIVDSFKKNEAQAKRQNKNANVQYEIDQDEWEIFYEQQRKLLALLMKENDFVSQDYIPSNLIRNYSDPVKDKQHSSKDQLFEDNQIGMKFNTLDTEQNPQSTQFFFCKHYQNINFQKIFANGAGSFKVSQDEKYQLESKAMSWILQTKSDQIYTNQKFQKQTYKKYSNLLKSMYQKPEDYTESQIMNNLLETSAYVLNSVHYYQKFKLKCDLLHPLDLLLVIQKIRKNVKKSKDCQMLEEKLENGNNHLSELNEPNLNHADSNKKAQKKQSSSKMIQEEY